MVDLKGKQVLWTQLGETAKPLTRTVRSDVQPIWSEAAAKNRRVVITLVS